MRIEGLRSILWSIGFVFFMNSVPAVFAQAPQAVPVKNWTMHKSTAGASAADSGAGLLFIAITPCRLMDTRAVGGSGKTGAFGPPSLVAGEARMVSVPSSNCGVPAAAAYSMNFVSITPLGQPVGWIAAWPDDIAWPGTVVVNAVLGGIIDNSAIVPAAADGGIQLLTTNDGDLVIDMNGYYVQATTVEGPAGPQGPPGDIGETGARGPQGADSTVAGPAGSPGLTGASGAQGAIGYSGAPGPAGSIGATGAMGAASTVAGPTGLTGASGAQGAVGIAGVAGPIGLTGAIGAASNVAGPAGPIGSTGPIGVTGASGSQGVIGNNGVAGPTGSTGPTGAPGAASNIAGPTGPIGSTGPIGLTGASGLQGVIGNNGVAGPTGSTGPTGATGAVSNVAGPTGASGPAGANGVIAFAEFYSKMPGDNAATVGVGTDVSFPQSGPSSATSIIRINGTTFNLSTVGTYQVMFQVSVDEPGQMDLTLNGTELGYTVSGRATGTTQIVGMALVMTTVANSTLSVRNPSGNSTALTITPIAGGTRSVSASLLISQIR